MKNKQMTLSGSGFEKYAKTTRRAQFLAEMETVVPWAKLQGLIEPVYPKGEGGRPAVPLERMMRIYLHTVVSSGTGSAARSIPANALMEAESYSASSTAGSDRLNQCCRK